LTVPFLALSLSRRSRRRWAVLVELSVNMESYVNTVGDWVREAQAS
jgi:hypothetical protein